MKAKTQEMEIKMINNNLEAIFMIKSKKFIIVQSESVANQLIAHGFHLLSNTSGTYTFINEQKESFNFSNIDFSQVHFTDKLFI